MEDDSSPSTTRVSGTNQDAFSRFTRFCLYYIMSIAVVSVASYLTDVREFWHVMIWLIAALITRNLYDKALTFLPFKLRDNK